ncbi:hypothetical protein D3C72_1586290 [compost metagenome]
MQRAREAGDPVGGAVVVLGDAGDHAQAAVADIQQVVGDTLRGGGVVPAHRRPRFAIAVVAGGDEWDALGLQELVKLGVAATADQHHGVHAALYQRAHLARLARRTVIGAGQQQLVAVVVDGLLHAVDQLGEQGAVDRGDDGAHRAGLARGQRTGRAVGYIARFGQQGHGAGAQVGPHFFRVIQHPRQGGRGNAAAGGDGLQRVARQWAGISLHGLKALSET